MVTTSNAEVLQRWRSAVNATPATLDEWLTTPQSASVGSRAPGAAHSVGQLAGMRTVDLLQTPETEWNDSDWAHVRRTIGFVRRHRAQWPGGDLRTRRWTYALRNWGHDPLWWGRIGAARLEDGAQDVVVDGETVGVASLTVTRSSVLVDRLKLLPDWRGRGVGSAMLHEICRIAERGVEVDLFGEEVASAKFFERRGFAVVDSSPEHTHLALPPG